MKRGRRQRTGICGALPFRRSAAPERDVDISRAQDDAPDMQSHKIAVAEFRRRGRLAWNNLPIEVVNLMPKRGDAGILHSRRSPSLDTCQLARTCWEPRDEHNHWFCRRGASRRRGRDGKRTQRRRRSQPATSVREAHCRDEVVEQSFELGQTRSDPGSGQTVWFWAVPGAER